MNPQPAASPSSEGPSHTYSPTQIGERCDEDQEDTPTLDERENESHISDDEYESEEDMVYPFDHHSARDQLRGHEFPFQPRQISTRLSAADFDRNESSNNLIDRLKIEMAGLRRQSADAVSLSLRMSDQLAEAQADASRARAALRTAESMLEDEGRKRREAEQAADEEARKKRDLEEKLRSLQMQLSRQP